MNLEIFKNSKELWKAVLGEIELTDPGTGFKTFVKRTKAEDFEENIIKIICDDLFVKKNLETKYLNQIKKSIRKLTSKDIQLKIVVQKFSTKKSNSPEEDLGPLFKPQRDINELIQEKQQRSNLIAKFTFDTFVMGKNNNLAYAVATAVADNPGELYNPVFLYSRVGLGKTHLIQAIGNQVLKNKPGTRVIYTTGETFTNELIEAIKGGKGKRTTNEFRNKFRKADVFLIDDVQFIIGKETTQEEFFHTYNALHMAQKQIVITSDRPPRDFSSIADRITSRFSSGIVVDIQAPDMEMRSAILRRKRDEQGDLIPNEIINFIAENVTTNIRELEGAYLQVITHTKALGTALTVEMAAEILGASLKEKTRKNINMNEVMKAVCTYYSVKQVDLKGKRRTKEIVLPRQVAMYLMKEITETPFMTIGDFLGGRDHTTIMHGVDKIEDQIGTRDKIRQDVVNVRQIIFSE